MSSAAPRERDIRRARAARWIGLDRNPMRRTSDRIEAVLRLVTVVLLVTMVPVAAIVAGRIADHVVLGQARAQQAADHQVTAVLTETAPGAAAADPYVAVETTWAEARWTAPDGATHTGMVLAALGAPAGSRVPTWINASGQVTDPPADHSDVVGAVFIAGTLATLAMALLILAFQGLVRHALDRRRLAAWASEWRAIGPRWTTHRSLAVPARPRSPLPVPGPYAPAPPGGADASRPRRKRAVASRGAESRPAGMGRSVTSPTTGSADPYNLRGPGPPPLRLNVP